MPMNRSGDGNAYNRFVNLDNIEYRIVNYLAKSKTKYANNLWKILKYDTEDCLSLPDVSYKDRMALLYKNNGDSTQQLLCMEEKAFKSVRQSQKPCQQCTAVSRISPEISITWIQMAEC